MVFLTLPLRLTKRVPMIKFRAAGVKGGQGGGSSGSSASSSNKKPSSAQSGGPVLEDYELPPRYWRKPMSQAEMDYINRGGPE